MFVAPVDPLVVLPHGKFGPRPKVLADGVTPGPLHPGLDLACILGQAVRAMADGIVLRSYLSENLRKVPVWMAEAGLDGKPVQAKDAAGNPLFKLEKYPWRPNDPKPDVMGYGETIVLLHPDGSQTRYAHLSRRLVELEGEHVRAGQPIGQAGTTGYSYGVHLHLEVKPDGRHVADPLPLLAHLNPVVL